MKLGVDDEEVSVIDRGFVVYRSDCHAEETSYDEVLRAKPYHGVSYSSRDKVWLYSYEH